MITHKIERDIFSDKLSCVSSCSIDKSLTSSCINLTPDNIAFYQQRVERNFLIRIIKSMVKQRYENITRSEVGINSKQLLDFDKIERMLSIILDANYMVFLQKIDAEIIPLLRNLTPGKHSRFYDNYVMKLSKTENYIKQVLLQIQSSESQTTEANIGGLFR